MWKHLRLSVKTGCSVRVKESMVGSVDGHSSAGLRPGKGDAWSLEKNPPSLKLASHFHPAT